MNRGRFRPGHDPRRHQFTLDERRRGGRTTMLRYLVKGPWLLNWLDRCQATGGGDGGQLSIQGRR
jgi:hypothetical protein